MIHCNINSYTVYNKYDVEFVGKKISFDVIIFAINLNLLRSLFLLFIQ